MLLEEIALNTTNYIKQMPKETRKKYGQFFTGIQTARYMASMFSLPNISDIKVLDAGAGSGILVCALVEKLLTGTYNSIDITVYDNDINILPLLRENMESIAQQSPIITYHIIDDNYILSQKDEYNDKVEQLNKDKYDLIISNPPYLKIPKDAEEALATPDVCYGAPNLYFIFAAMSLYNLKPDCEMTYIIPRSWTSGAYFTKFRQKFLSECRIQRMHIFVSRDKVFENESVLQETMIIKVKKTQLIPEFVTISSTETSADFTNVSNIEVPYNVVVHGNDKYVFLVTNEDDSETLTHINRFTYTMPKINIKMKTGLTVDFRNREVLRENPNEHTYPLYYAQHIQGGKVVFPVGRDIEYIETDRSGFLQNNVNYLFVKRFTAKEERRRLQCGIYLSSDHPNDTQISTQNKINFICGLENPLTTEQVYGLYVLFNSTLYDNYYRILNGSTQVNSTEVNTMPVPDFETIASLGRQLIAADSLTTETCDTILGALYE